MNLLLSEYMRRCCKNYKPLGFRRNKQTYARVVGDVFHRFTLVRSRSGYSCTINFAIIPLCMELPAYLDVGGYSMERFVVKKDLFRPIWTYNAASPESVNECLDQMFSCFDKNVLSLFARVDNCETAFSELLRLRNLFESNYYTFLALHQMTGRDVSDDRYFNTELFYIALKTHRYEFAQKALEARIRSGIEGKNRMINAYKNDPSFLQRWLLDYERCYKQHSTLLEQILTGQTEKINAILQRNENESLRTIQMFLKLR